MPWTIDARFKTADNRAVVEFILRHPTLSAHDDAAEALTDSAQGLSDARWHCPDVHAYAYVVLHTQEGRIFGIAHGQRTLAYRLPTARIAEALAEGGAVHAEIGPDWVLFDPWQGTRPGAISRWCKIAHDHAVAPPERRDR